MYSTKKKKYDYAKYSRDYRIRKKNIYRSNISLKVLLCEDLYKYIISFCPPIFPQNVYIFSIDFVSIDKIPLYFLSCKNIMERFGLIGHTDVDPPEWLLKGFLLYFENIFLIYVKYFKF